MYSHKCFGALVCSFIVLDYIIDTLRMIYLYDEEDIFDIYKDKIKGQNEITYNDIKNNFMKPVHILNSDAKIRMISEEVIRYKKMNPKNKLNILDLYSYFNSN